MEPNELFGDRLRTDPARTRAARAAWVRGGSEACGCATCRDWVARRADLISAELRSLLAGFGLEADHDSAVRRLDADEGSGFELLYHLVGELAGGAPDADLLADEDRLPDEVIAMRLCAGAELAPRSWPGESLELRVLLAADFPADEHLPKRGYQAKKRD